MNNENITNIWNFLYQMICWDISHNYNSTKRFQRHESLEKLLTLFPDEIAEIIKQAGPERQVENIIAKLFGKTISDSPSKLTMIEEVEGSFEKICPTLKPLVQNLLALLNSITKDAGAEESAESQNRDRLSNSIWDFCLHIAKRLPLPDLKEVTPNLEDAKNTGMQNAVLQRLKKEVLPNEIADILSMIEEDRLPRDVNDSPMFEDFPITSSDEQACLPTSLSDSGGKWKCRICGQVLQSNDLLQCHMKQEHFKMQGSYTCNVCRRRFTFQCDLELHQEKHGHICTVCKQVFASTSALQRHSLSHKQDESRTKAELHECKFCEKLFLLKSHQVEHEEQHVLQQRQPDANDTSNVQEDSAALTQFKKNMETFQGHSCTYVLSSDDTLCFNMQENRYRRVADIVKPCHVAVRDVVLQRF